MARRRSRRRSRRRRRRTRRHSQRRKKRRSRRRRRRGGKCSRMSQCPKCGSNWGLSREGAKTLVCTSCNARFERGSSVCK